MPICSNCGSYYSEKVCSCVGEEDPDSPVKTISADRVRSVRIINPIELLDKIEEAEAKLNDLEEDEGAKVQSMTDQLARESNKEEKLQKEVDAMQLEIPNLETSIKATQEKNQGLIQQNTHLQHELEASKAKFIKLTEVKTQKEQEATKLRSEV